MVVFFHSCGNFLLLLKSAKFLTPKILKSFSGSAAESWGTKVTYLWNQSNILIKTFSKVCQIYFCLSFVTLFCFFVLQLFLCNEWMQNWAERAWCQNAASHHQSTTVPGWSACRLIPTEGPRREVGSSNYYCNCGGRDSDRLLRDNNFTLVKFTNTLWPCWPESSLDCQRRKSFIGEKRSKTQLSPDDSMPTRQTFLKH